MNLSDISSLRLRNQHLSQPNFKRPADVVEHLGAVQAQDYAAAKWALGIRMQNTTDADIEDAYNKGEILRTHVMRPTWHYVMPEDIRWMLTLTAPRVKKFLAHYDRTLEITEKLLSRCQKIFTNALQDEKYLTRSELAEQLEKNKIVARGQRLGHIVMHAELDAVLCSGPRRGKQFTYTLLEKRTPKVKKLNRDESLAKLALKYFVSHGPAQTKDFSWWSGLSMKDAVEGLDLIKSKLAQESVEGKTYWFSPTTKVPRPFDFAQGKPIAYLLSIYDEYTIAYKDRSTLGGEHYVEKLISMGNALTAVIVLDGQIVGTWKRAIKKNGVEIQLNPFRKLDKSEHVAIEKAAKLYGKFLEMKVASLPSFIL